MIEKNDKNATSNNFVIKEFIETEKKYNAQLDLLWYAFQMDVLIQNSPILQDMKPFILKFKELSDDLLKNVENAFNPNVTDATRRKLRDSRTLLINEFYKQHASFSKLCTAFIEQTNDNPEQFKAFNFYLKNSTKDLQEAKKELLQNCSLDYKTLLAEPRLRGIRYELMIKSTKQVSAHLDEFNVSEFESLATMLNERLEEINSLVKVPHFGPTREYYIGYWTQTLISKIINIGASTPDDLYDVVEIKPQDTVPEKNEPEVVKEGYWLGKYSYTLFTTAKTLVLGSGSNPKPVKISELNEDGFTIVDSKKP